MKNLEIKLVDNIHEIIDRAEEVSFDKHEIKKIIKQLENYLTFNNVNSISAPLIGINKRIFSIKFDDGIHTFINPMIGKRFGLHLARVKPVYSDLEYIIPYNDSIIAAYQELKINDVDKDVKLTNESNRFEGTAAEIFQQEVNLLDGVLVSDYGLEVCEEFDKASDDERSEVIDAYIKILEQADDEMRQQIENDPELKKMITAVNFMAEVASGNVKFEKKDEPKISNTTLIQMNGSMRNFVNTKKPSRKTKKKG